ncbi:MAG: hypothetical protein ABSB32_13260 [Thermodesulfobacteriota bacterium]|jgi:hypothetical protein
MFDLELEKQTAVSSVFTGVNPVFTPVLNTVKEDEMVNIIEYSGDEPDGVKVLSEIPGGEGKNFEKAQEEPGKGHGNGEGVEDLDEPTKALAEEFAPFMNRKTTLTPHLCRKGCNHYDSVGDQKNAEFREFCWKSKETRIERDSVCGNFESKSSDLPEGILTF